MEALRRKCRPKHQVLILRCYPQIPKNSAAADIKPNGSELSYLLYYAASRRSKLTKVGAFLEKRTASDVYKGRTNAVLVTLQILTAFLSSGDVSAGNGFQLFAPYVLHILSEILSHAADAALVDACLPVWDAFCKDQDHATLAADAEYRSLFAAVVKSWAEYASKDGNKKLGGARGRLGASVGDALKLRKAGLEAVRSIAASEALASEPGRQLNVVMPVVLQNLYSRDPAYLASLDRKEKERTLQEKELSSRMRPSMSTVRTAESDPRAAEGTAADADQLAEDECAVLAMQCLKSIFDVENRGQIRQATTCVLAFIATLSSADANGANLWATALVEMVCTWTPVQDRFIVLFVAVETLIRSPIVEEELDKQLVLAHIVGRVLASSINLIGLSVMDILLGLVQHVLLILQLGTAPPTLNGAETTSSEESLKSGAAEKQRQSRLVMEVVKTPSPTRVHLLAQLRQCLANLATHVYYTDQISDMVSAILLRLKPSQASSRDPSITASAIEDPSAAAQDVASNVSLRERPNTDGFFSFDMAREVALNAVKDIISVANTAQLDGSSRANSRNAVPISVWEGTQWLLRDPHNDVRKAYVDALCTWLRLETIKNDSKLDEKTTPEKQRKDHGDGNMARRAVSNASARNRAAKRGRSTFLQLLNLAIYEDALQRAEASDGDSAVLLLHLLLVTLCEKLGINAVRTGLPMLFRLQEDIQVVADPKAKIRLGSLVHGYLWELCEKFDFESSPVGRIIHSEIARRRQHGIWITGVQVPPALVADIDRTVAAGTQAKLSKDAVQHEELKPFDHRQQLVERIGDAYPGTVASPPVTPGSPGRSFSLPTLSLDPSEFLSPQGQAGLPSAYTEELMADWTKANVLAALVAAGPKSVSLSGSRTGAQSHGSAVNLSALGNHRALLGAANTFPMYKGGDSASQRTSPSPSRGILQKPSTAHSNRSHSVARRQRLASRSPGGARRPSASTSGPASTQGGNTLRVEELKRVLATGNAAHATPGSYGGGALGVTGADRRRESDTGSESMMDVEEPNYDDDARSSVSVGSSPGTPPVGRARGSRSGGGDDNVPASAPDEPQQTVVEAGGHIVVLNGGGGETGTAPAPYPPAAATSANGPSSRRIASRASAKPFGGAAGTSATAGSVAGKPDLRELLDSIGTGDGEDGEDVGETSGIVAPPY
ncbi:hypothetical protein MBLNU459_g6513t1 [Dothideomycetes sp. NU459]